MSYQCELYEQAAQPTLSVRLRLPVQDLGATMGRVYPAIAQYLAELGEPMAGAPFAAYYNMDMADLDTEIGIPVARLLPGRDDIMPGEMPAGRVARCVYTGPYSGLRPAYDALGAFCAEQGVTPTGVAYEIYIDDPGEKPAAELRTIVALAVQ
ncbi:MAG: GyrI-like domain-containing protein [Anaerolineae bacterium]|nr:GyrI-like domain-containing protein [Anaerolineae bacterium]